MVVGPFVLIVVHQLRTGGDRLYRLDEDALAIIDRLAVRIAGVIDEPGVVPVHGGVDARLVIDREQEGVVAVQLVVVVPLVRRAPRDALAEILDDPSALPDRARRERPRALNRRRAKLEIGVWLLFPGIARLNAAARRRGARRALSSWSPPLPALGRSLRGLRRTLLASRHCVSRAPDGSSDRPRRRAAGREAPRLPARIPSAGWRAVPAGGSPTDASKARHPSRDAAGIHGSRARDYSPCATSRRPCRAARARRRIRMPSTARRASRRTSCRARRRACAPAPDPSFRTASPRGRAVGNIQSRRDRVRRRVSARPQQDQQAPRRGWGDGV